MSFSPSVATVLQVNESSQIGEVRRTASQLAKQLGFDETRVGTVALLATEIATNLVKHARQGEVYLQQVHRSDMTGIELLSIDRGPGIADLERSLRDGYSTSGTSGSGLGAMKRMADEFAMHSIPQTGTIVLARIWQKPLRSAVKSTDSLLIGAINVPIAGETACGDSWASHQEAGHATIMVADGLGHGVMAAAASLEARRVFADNLQREPAELLQLMHGALRSTRGAAVLIVTLDLELRKARCAGIGNVSAMIVSGEQSRSVVSLNGTLGFEARKFQEFDYEWPARATLLMFSDGLSSQTRLDRRPDLAGQPPSVIAAVLLRDFRRPRDDATIVVARENLSA